MSSGIDFSYIENDDPELPGISIIITMSNRWAQDASDLCTPAERAAIAAMQDSVTDKLSVLAILYHRWEEKHGRPESG